MFSSPQNSHFPAARRTLIAADTGVYGPDVLSVAIFATEWHGVRNAAFPAVTRWIRSILVGGSSPPEFSTDTAIVSSFKLPMTTCEETLNIMSLEGCPVTCNMQSKRLCKGAGGRKVRDIKERPEVLKIGPDSWRVTAQV